MKYHKAPILGMIAGLVIMVCSIVRWFFIWYDPSQMVIGITLGVLISVLAYIYNWMKLQEDNYNDMNKRLDAFTEWWTRQEIN
jgi:H+/Cl- antiporter ClcA